jgi:hypothetical protein
VTFTCGPHEEQISSAANAAKPKNSNAANNALAQGGVRVHFSSGPGLLLLEELFTAS